MKTGENGHFEFLGQKVKILASEPSWGPWDPWNGLKYTPLTTIEWFEMSLSVFVLVENFFLYIYAFELIYIGQLVKIYRDILKQLQTQWPTSLQCPVKSFKTISQHSCWQPVSDCLKLLNISPLSFIDSGSLHVVRRTINILQDGSKLRRSQPSWWMQTAWSMNWCVPSPKQTAKEPRVCWCSSSDAWARWQTFQAQTSFIKDVIAVLLEHCGHGCVRIVTGGGTVCWLTEGWQRDEINFSNGVGADFNQQGLFELTTVNGTQCQQKPRQCKAGAATRSDSTMAVWFSMQPCWFVKMKESNSLCHWNVLPVLHNFTGITPKEPGAAQMRAFEQSTHELFQTQVHAKIKKGPKARKKWNCSGDSTQIKWCSTLSKEMKHMGTQSVEFWAKSRHESHCFAPISLSQNICAQLISR